MFGKETAGLPEKLLHDNPETCVRIPMLNNPDARSLNLSNSVAVGAYEVLRQWNYPNSAVRRDSCGNLIGKFLTNFSVKSNSAVKCLKKEQKALYNQFKIVIK